MRRVNVFLLSFILLASQISYSWSFEYNRAINLAGKQRMLTQKMSKEALLVALDIDKKDNLIKLKETRNLFDKTLKGLRDGDRDLRLSQTIKPKIRRQLSKVENLWIQFNRIISKIIRNGEVTQEDIGVIAKLNLPLLKEMNKAVKFYETKAAGSGVNQALAKAINLSGRQRMLTQKMSKEFYLVGLGHDVEKNKASLQKTVDTFAKTLEGLIYGDASMGLSAAPTDQIIGQLRKVKVIWEDFKKNIKSEPSEQTKNAVAQTNLPLLKEMNAAVQMFEKL